MWDRPNVEVMNLKKSVSFKCNLDFVVINFEINVIKQ